MKVASKIILRSRAEGRFQKIKTYIKGCDTKEKVRQFVKQDWERAEYFGIGKKDYVKLLLLREISRMFVDCIEIRIQQKQSD